MKKSIVLLLSFIGIVIVFSIIRSIIYPKKNKNKYTRTISKDYLLLFTPEMQRQFISKGILGTISMPSGLSVSSIIYSYEENGNGRVYDIELFKVGLKEDKPLDEIIQIKKPNKGEYADTGFTELSEGGFDLKLKDGKNSKVSKVTWNFDGDILKLDRKQDNLLYYDVQFNYFTINYDNGSEFWAKKINSFLLHSSGKFIFIKKNLILYTIFFADEDPFFLKPSNALKLLNETFIK